MSITRNQVALNALQWINLKQPEGGAEHAPVWLYFDPAWRSEQPKVHAQIKAAGFDNVMMEVLDTQTLQNYKRMLDGAGLAPAPGYLQVALPEFTGQTLTRGSAEWVRWFDNVRRAAEQTNFLGLSSIFLAVDMLYDGNPRISDTTAVGAFFDQGRLDRIVEYLGEAAEILKSEGVRAGLHNHVGTWVETREEIDYILGQIDPTVLGASFDIGHLAWAGIDYIEILQTYKDRLVDLHLKDMDLNIAEASRATSTPYYRVADQRFFLEPGLGDVNLDGVIQELNAQDFKGWIIIEVDRASMEPFDSAKYSWQWVEEHFPA